MLMAHSRGVYVSFDVASVSHPQQLFQAQDGVHSKARLLLFSRLNARSFDVSL